MPPASFDGENIKRRSTIRITGYIELYEVCHPPVPMEKILSAAVSLGSIRIAGYIELYEVCHPPVSMEKILSAAVSLELQVTSNCMRCATRQL